MKNASIVLGLSFGDEGKGKTVDYLCANSHKSPLVVRFSGGQQCGHTVMIDDQKHIHASFPSGTLRGVPGYIEQTCTVSIVHLKNEWVELSTKISSFDLTVHPLAILTTPFEIAYNRMTETYNKHGSCGCGVGATMKRQFQTPYKLHVIDLTNKWLLEQKLEQIDVYYKNILSNKSDEEKYIYLQEFLKAFKNFKKSIEWFLKNVKVQQIDYNKYENVIFEGSQGILLDMDHGIFPHVTYANTTSKNIIHLLEDVKNVNTYYITRCYSTRHGNGPLQNETELSLIHNKEEINVSNKWQGDLRYAPLNIDLLQYAYNLDRQYNTKGQTTLCVNCIDQLEAFDLKDLYKQFNTTLISGTPKSFYHNFKTIYNL